MSPNDLLQAQWADMVFEGRNKAYGGYNLRRIYDSHIMRALVIGGLAFIIGMCLPMLYSKAFAKGTTTAVNVELSKIDKAKEEVKKAEVKKPKEIEKKPLPKAQVKFIPPVVKKDDEVKREEPPPKIDSTLFKQNVGTKDVKGTETLTNTKVEETIEVIEKDPPKVVEDNETYTFVEQEASFGEGGKDAAVKWIQQNIAYPAIARENGLQGKVFITFVVGKNGKVVDVAIAKDNVGGGCAEEAMRVIKSMPDWKPGKQNGNAVKVKVTLPISFKLEG
jgi:periplasmic protein TonB